MMIAATKANRDRVSSSFSVKIGVDSEFRDDLIGLGVGYSDPCPRMGGPGSVISQTVSAHVLCSVKDSFSQYVLLYGSHWQL